MQQEKKFYGQTEYARGPEDVIACESAIGHIDRQAGRLIYRGYEISELAEHSNFEEVSYLLLFGKLPTGKEFDGGRSWASATGSIKPTTPVLRY